MIQNAVVSNQRLSERGGVCELSGESNCFLLVTYNVYIHLYGDALEEMRSVVG